MIRTEFHQPTGDVIENISIDKMKKYIVDEFLTYWRQGSGDGYIDYYVDESKQYTMMIGPNENHGIYLQYLDHVKQETWLSLENDHHLEDVAETADEIYASIGLFLPIETAWEGVKAFLLTGNRSEKIMWTEPHIIPENGNY